MCASDEEGKLKVLKEVGLYRVSLHFSLTVIFLHNSPKDFLLFRYVIIAPLTEFSIKPGPLQGI